MDFFRSKLFSWTLKKWSSQNVFNFKAGKTKCCLISRHEDKSILYTLFESSTLKMCDKPFVGRLNLLEWAHILCGGICHKEPGLPILIETYFTPSPSQFLTLYKLQICPCPDDITCIRGERPLSIFFPGCNS